MPEISLQTQNNTQLGEGDEERPKRSRIPNMFKSLIGVIKVETLFGRLRKKNKKNTDEAGKATSYIEDTNQSQPNEDSQEKNQVLHDLSKPSSKNQVFEEGEEEKETLNSDFQSSLKSKLEEASISEMGKQQLHQHKINLLSDQILKKDLNTPSPNLLLEKISPLSLESAPEIIDSKVTLEAHLRALEPNEIAKETATGRMTPTNFKELEDNNPDNSELYGLELENKTHSLMYLDNESQYERDNMSQQRKRFRSKSCSSSKSEVKSGFNYISLDENLDLEDYCQENSSKPINDFSPNLITYMDERP